jgi:hypothetical protein
VVGLVVLKMLPFDNKSSSRWWSTCPRARRWSNRRRAARARRDLATVPEVTDYQAYAGTAAPINFNGLVRQYYLRASGKGRLQVNLVDKHHRSEQSHAIASAAPGAAGHRPAPGRQRQGGGGAAGPPVLSPIVAEVYGPDAAGRRAVAQQVRAIFAKTRVVVSTTPRSPRRRAPWCWWTGARRRCRRAAGGHRPRCAPAWPARTPPTCDGPASTRRRCAAAAAEQQGSLDALLQLPVRQRGQRWCRCASW